MQSIQKSRSISRVPAQHFGGFTLVEMLVATGLAVLIMTMFAQIYSGALGMMSEQKGIGANDQKARMLSTLLRTDLSSMTYRQTADATGASKGIVPLTPGDSSTTGTLDVGMQRGYFYISENDPYNPQDDVLQFTAEVPVDDTDDYHVGLASDITDAITDPMNPYSLPNQPFRDGGPSTGAPGKSRAAEVCYFMRNGNLYRRVFLLREPLVHTPTYDTQPGNDAGTAFYGIDNEDLRDNTGNYIPFWGNFDYSATRFFYDPNDSAGGGSNGRTSNLYFNGINSLSNESGTAPVALPWNRFGHLNDQRIPPAVGAANANHGMPREYLGQDSTQFLGRFTKRETASSEFHYPGRETPRSYMLFNRSDTSLTYNDADDVVNELSDNTSFVAEDVVLTDVESFDVEVWEVDNAKFVQMGHDLDSTDAFPGEYVQGNVLNQTYGPRVTPSGPGSLGNRIFDTWHPGIAFPGLSLSNVLPPYRPVIQAGTPTPWAENTTYAIGATIAVPTLHNGAVYSNSWLYKVVAVMGGGTTGTSGLVSDGTAFPAVLGNTVRDNNLLWMCVDNRKGLRAIRITVRYLDIQTRLPRQVSVVHSFVE